MSSIERELLTKLRQLHEEYVRLNEKITDATQRQKYLNDPAEIATAERDEQRYLVEVNRLMDRLRALEGQIVQIRKTGRRRFQ